MSKRTFRRMILKRSINVIITIFGIVTLNFLLINFMPGDPIHQMIPRDPKFNDNIKWDLIEKFHFNDTLPEKYVTISRIHSPAIGAFPTWNKLPCWISS